MVGRKFSLAGYDSIETLTWSSLHPSTVGETEVGEGHLAVQATDRSEDHPALGLAILTTSLILFGNLQYNQLLAPVHFLTH